MSYEWTTGPRKRWTPAEVERFRAELEQRPPALDEPETVSKAHHEAVVRVSEMLVERVARAMHEAPDAENHAWGDAMCFREWEYGGCCREMWIAQAKTAVEALSAEFSSIKAEIEVWKGLYQQAVERK